MNQLYDDISTERLAFLQSEAARWTPPPAPASSGNAVSVGGLGEQP